MISIVFWKLRKCRFCHHLLVPCFRQPPLVAAEMLSLPLADLAGRLILCFFLLWVICDTSRAKLRRCGNVHLWRYLWTSRQEMVHSNEWSETVQIRSYITLYNIMCISTYILYIWYMGSTSNFLVLHTTSIGISGRNGTIECCPIRSRSAELSSRANALQTSILQITTSNH